MSIDIRTADTSYMGGGAGSTFASPRFNSRTKVKRNDTFLTMGDEGSAAHNSPFRNMNYEGMYFLAVHLQKNTGCPTVGVNSWTPFSPAHVDGF